jgi:hypothetical protein
VALLVTNVRSSTRMGPGGRLVHGTIVATLAARQETRRAGYSDLGQHRLLVFAMDECGMMSRDAQTLLRECIAVREDRLDVEGRHSTWACRTFSSLWKQRLSVTLARRLACVIMLRAVVCSCGWGLVFCVFCLLFVSPSL